MTDETDPRALPLAFALGVVGAFVGHLLGGHEGEWIYHLPHEALLGVPLALLGVLALRPRRPGDIIFGAIAGAAGFVAGALLLLLA